MRGGIVKRVRRVLEFAMKRRLMRRADLWDALSGYVAASGTTGCSYADYEALYRAIRRHRPKEVLECGTGASTVVIAEALRENERDGFGRGRVTSMEESEAYAAEARRLLPVPLAPYVEIVVSPTVEDYWALFRGVRYRDIPERPYEFVFVDGPKTSSPVDGAKTFDFDLIHVLKSADRPVRAIVDLRLSTVFALRHVLGERNVRFDRLRNLGFVGPVTKRDLKTTNEFARL